MRTLALLVFSFCILGLKNAAAQMTDAPDASPSIMVEAEALPELGPSPREDEAFVDGVIAAYTTEHGSAGYTVSFVRDQTTVFAKGYGLADAEKLTPVTPDQTRFYIGSISKTFVWTAVMMAVEEGLIDLDADLNTYLKRYEVPEGNEPLTMNHLMAHRVGLEDTFGIFVPENGALPLPEAVAATEPAPVFARGDRTAYSNWGSILAALVLEDATGRTYEDILFNDILKPLGMNDTTLNAAHNGGATSALARSYKVTATGLIDAGQLDLGAFAPIGGMTSTAADMAQWVRLHMGEGAMDGVRLLSPQSYALLRSRAFEDRPLGADMAHGLQDIPYRSTRMYGHGGSINNFLSNMIIAPEFGVGVFISQNIDATRTPIVSLPRHLVDRELARVGRLPVDRVIGDVDQAGNEEDVKAAAAIATAAAGSYISNRRPHSGFPRFFGLQSVVKLTAHGENLIRSDETAAPYRGIAPDVFENRFGARMTLIRNEAGDVVAFANGSGTATSERIGFRTNPAIAAASLASVVFLSITTWLGLWRRIGRGEGGATPIGRMLSLGALVATGVVVLFLATLMILITSVGNLSYAEIFGEYPPDGVSGVMLMATIVAVIGGLMAVSVIPAWTSSGWSVWRKAHHTAFGLVFGFSAFMLMNQGLAFSSAAGG